MESKIFKQIVERQIQQFVGIFSEDSSVIFKDEKNKLIHPGEYGKYREEVCKTLLRLILNKNVNISDGFVITANDEITTQCDIIGYNADVSPLITDGIAKMFPAEEVRMIGEVKSNLSKQEFIDALRKMAENKKIVLKGRRGNATSREVGNNKAYDTIISFLVCNKLDFRFEELAYDEIYEGIERKYWHNTILSVEDVVMRYLFRMQDFPSEVKEYWKKNKLKTDIEAAWQYPIYECGGLEVSTQQSFLHRRAEDKYEHIKCFLIEIATGCRDVWNYTYDPVNYLGFALESIYEDGIL